MVVGTLMLRGDDIQRLCLVTCRAGHPQNDVKLSPHHRRSGKKYAKLVKAAKLDAGLSKYEPFIVRSKNLEGMLFCALTGELLNARLEEVKQHLKGKKFGRAKGEQQRGRRGWQPC